ncbi:MAG: DUF6542 domain-containing protein [Mycobacterium sp.]
MSGQRARPAVAADHRSVVPHIPGVPSWGAVLIAVTASAIGFAFDAGSGAKELTAVFSGAYVLGCIAAVLAVRQSGVFAAVIQPPLILFVCVPGAYYLFHGAAITGLRDLLINCGYPLIERFPLMFFTSAAVLLIGMGRWYHGMTTRRGVAQGSEQADDGRRSSVTSKIASMLTRESEDDAVDEAPAPRRRQHSIDRPTKAAKPPAAGTARTRGGRPIRRTEPSRSRHTRPPETEIIDPVAERPRRPRVRQAEPPPPAEPHRRPRTPSTRESRQQPPPSDRRSPYQRPERRSRFDGFEPFEPHGESGSNNGTHHPVSRVRYRGGDDSDRRPEYRTRPRASRQAEAWEYDA